MYVYSDKKHQKVSAIRAIVTAAVFKEKEFILAWEEGVENEDVEEWAEFCQWVHNDEQEEHGYPSLEV